MTKPRLVALAGAFGAVAFLGYEISRRLLEIGTLPTLNVRRYTIGPGAVILAEGSWKKAGGSGMAVPEPNAVRIRCDTNAGECKMDEAQVEDWSGSRYLRLLETEDYHIVSWGDGILVAQALNSYGAAPEDHAEDFGYRQDRHADLARQTNEAPWEECRSIQRVAGRDPKVV